MLILTLNGKTLLTAAGTVMISGKFLRTLKVVSVPGKVKGHLRRGPGSQNVSSQQGMPRRKSAPSCLGQQCVPGAGQAESAGLESTAATGRNRGWRLQRAPVGYEDGPCPRYTSRDEDHKTSPWQLRESEGSARLCSFVLSPPGTPLEFSAV